MVPPRLEGHPSFLPGAGTAFGKGPARSTTMAWRTPHLNNRNAKSRKTLFFFLVFFPQIGAGQPDSAQPEPVVHWWSVPQRLTGATDGLPPLCIADVGTVLGAPIPLKNCLQLLPDGAGAGSTHCLVHHQCRSRCPHKVVTRPVGCPCKKIWRGTQKPPPSHRHQQLAVTHTAAPPLVPHSPIYATFSVTMYLLWFTRA